MLNYIDMTGENNVCDLVSDQKMHVDFIFAYTLGCRPAVQCIFCIQRVLLHKYACFDVDDFSSLYHTIPVPIQLPDGSNTMK